MTLKPKVIFLSLTKSSAGKNGHDVSNKASALKIEVFKKMSITKNMPLNSMKKKLRMIPIIFDIENWKSEIDNFRSLDLERVLIYQNFFLWKSAIFHSIKLPFDAEVAEKFLNGI